jgi:hypothetical protein
MVRQALANAVPAKHCYPARAKPKLGALVAFIDEVPTPIGFRRTAAQRKTGRTGGQA